MRVSANNVHVEAQHLDLQGNGTLTESSAGVATFTVNGQTVTAGALAKTGAWVSGTAKVNPVTRQIVVVLEIVTDGTANAATCAVAISPDNDTYSTVATPGASSAVNTVGAVTLLASVTLPVGWYIKLTLSHAAVADSFYY